MVRFRIGTSIRTRRYLNIIFLIIYPVLGTFPVHTFHGQQCFQGLRLQEIHLHHNKHHSQNHNIPLIYALPLNLVTHATFGVEGIFPKKNKPIWFCTIVPQNIKQNMIKVSVQNLLFRVWTHNHKALRRFHASYNIVAFMWHVVWPSSESSFVGTVNGETNMSYKSYTIKVCILVKLGMQRDIYRWERKARLRVETMVCRNIVQRSH